MVRECYKRKAVFAGMLLFLMLCMLLAGCNYKGKDVRSDIEFTVCCEKDIPEDFLKIIEDKKQNPFAMSYVTDNEMYVAVGYGAHNQRNLNVVVEDFYVTDKAIYLDTNLFTTKMTPTDAARTGEVSMYPYIVLKCDIYDYPIYYNAP